MEVFLVRWMFRVTKLDKIRNERIKGKKKEEEIAKESPGKKVEACDAQEISTK